MLLPSVEGWAPKKIGSEEMNVRPGPFVPLSGLCVHSFDQRS